MYLLLSRSSITKKKHYSTQVKLGKWTDFSHYLQECGWLVTYRKMSNFSEVKFHLKALPSWINDSGKLWSWSFLQHTNASTGQSIPSEDFYYLGERYYGSCNYLSYLNFLSFLDFLSLLSFLSLKSFIHFFRKECFNLEKKSYTKTIT